MCFVLLFRRRNAVRRGLGGQPSPMPRARRACHEALVGNGTRRTQVMSNNADRAAFPCAEGGRNQEIV